MAAIGETEWKEHAAVVGAVTLAWNHNVHQVLRIFCHLTGLEDPLADAIFFSHASDRGQRQLVLKVAQAVDLGAPDLAKLKKLMERLDKAASGRNLAAHVIFGVTLFDPETSKWGPKVVPALTNQDHRLERDFAQQFTRVEQDLKAIYNDLDAWLRETPFPNRPWGHPPFPLAHERQIAADVETHAAQAKLDDQFGNASTLVFEEEAASAVGFVSNRDGNP